MENLLDFLQNRVELFKGFPKEKLNVIASASRVVEFEPGKPIIRFGEEGQHLGVILEGDAEALITDENGEKHRVGMLTVGDVFGEMSLMTSDKTNADVIGIE